MNNPIKSLQIIAITTPQTTAKEDYYPYFT